jgi:hypothetical protein
VSGADHPDDAALLAALEETGDVGGVAGHLAGCARCRGLVDAARTAATLVAAARVPDRAWCPPREALLAFAEAAPPPRLRQHVAACPACRDDVRDLLALDAAPAPAIAPAAAPAATLVARVVLALGALAGEAVRLVESTLPLGPTPALAAVRGPAAPGAPPVVVVASFGPGELEVAWGPAPGGADLRIRARGGAPRGYRVALSARREGAPDELWESRSSDEEGQVTLAALAPGRYALAVFGPQRQEPDLVVEVDLRAG